MSKSSKNTLADDENDLPSEPAFGVEQGDIVWIETDLEEDIDQAKSPRNRSLVGLS
jgi:hypothetical protein